MKVSAVSCGLVFICGVVMGLVVERQFDKRHPPSAVQQHSVSSGTAVSTQALNSPRRSSVRPASADMTPAPAEGTLSLLEAREALRKAALQPEPGRRFEAI